jgi:signal transduction histidine kinase
MIYFIAGLLLALSLAVPVFIWVARRTEKRVRQASRRALAAERLAELGKLTGGLAHEIKNPLSSVNLNIQLLQEDLQQIASDNQEQDKLESGDLDDRLGRINRRFETMSREVHRLRDILDDFLRFAGRVKLDLVSIDLNELIDELVDFFTPQASAAGVRLRAQPNDRDSIIQGDTSLLKQAILNLLINAIQSMDQARTDKTPSGGNDELLVRVEDDPKRGELWRIHVTDTGPGIEPEKAAKILQPYFSTKHNGTGLGLPTARRIIEEHGGTLSFHSEPGRGSDFVISLPTKVPES